MFFDHLPDHGQFHHKSHVASKNMINWFSHPPLTCLHRYFTHIFLQTKLLLYHRHIINISIVQAIKALDPSRWLSFSKNPWEGQFWWTSGWGKEGGRPHVLVIREGSWWSTLCLLLVSRSWSLLSVLYFVFFAFGIFTFVFTIPLPFAPITSDTMVSGLERVGRSNDCSDTV